MKDIAYGFLVGMLLTGGGIVVGGQKKTPPPPVAVECPPAVEDSGPREWVRALNNLHSRFDQLEKKIDARPLFVTSEETEDLHRRLLARPFPIYDGTITGKAIVLSPRREP